MRGNFVALREFLLNRYPGEFGPEDIVGSNYPPPWHAGYASTGTQFLQWSVLGLIFFGKGALGVLGYPGGAEPDWYKQLQENKMGAFIFVFFANSIAQSASTTGAFEIEIDGQLAFSKLEMGRMPNLSDIVRALEGRGISMPEAVE